LQLWEMRANHEEGCGLVPVLPLYVLVVEIVDFDVEVLPDFRVLFRVDRAFVVEFVDNEFLLV
jgi:hypothetical protein